MKNIKGIFVVAALVVVILAVVSVGQLGSVSPVILEGQVMIDEALEEQAQGLRTLFVVLYDAEKPMPMPYGAMREQISGDARGAFHDILVTKEKLQIMRPNAPTPRKFHLKVRLDRDSLGGADQPGDLTGNLNGVSFGSRDVRVKIDRLTH